MQLPRLVRSDWEWLGKSYHNALFPRAFFLQVHTASMLAHNALHDRQAQTSSGPVWQMFKALKKEPPYLCRRAGAAIHDAQIDMAAILVAPDHNLLQHRLRLDGLTRIEQ
jgi:hypothetical protein